MKLYEKFRIKNMDLRNRIVMPPMCMYQAGEDGRATNFHVTHYGTRAYGGAGLVIVEATAVSPEGRISQQDLGLWEDGQIEGMKKIVDAIHANGAMAAVQLNHAGRKCLAETASRFAPSPIPFSPDSPLPMELDNQQIRTIVSQFHDAMRRANAAGFDGVEIHAAHGYLIHEFLSPLANRRVDEYGEGMRNRTRFLHQILETTWDIWPQHKPVWVRVSASDYQPGGIDSDMMVEIVNLIKDRCAMVHVSSGGLLPAQVGAFPGYQVKFAQEIKRECAIPVIAVGMITDGDMAEDILSKGRADLVALGRELLRNPYWPMGVAAAHGLKELVPAPYRRAFE